MSKLKIKTLLHTQKDLHIQKPLFKIIKLILGTNGHYCPCQNVILGVKDYLVSK